MMMMMRMLLQRAVKMRDPIETLKSNCPVTVTLIKNAESNSFLPISSVALSWKIYLSTYAFVILWHFFGVRYDEQLEEFLDQAYENYVAIKGGSTKTCEKCLCPRGPTLKGMQSLWSNCVCARARVHVCNQAPVFRLCFLQLGCVIKFQFPLGLMWPLFFSLCHDSCCLHIVIFLLLLCKA